MKRKILKKSLIILILLMIIYWLPFVIIQINAKSEIANSIDQLPDSDVVIIFGTIVNENKEITPLLRERLEAGIAILKAKKAKKIVVSNTEEAANVMAKYLQEKGVPPILIEIDKKAEKTPDTCAYEKNQHPEKRKIIFISQGFHLPRLLYQCNKIGIKGIAFPAEKLDMIDNPEYSLFTKISVRTSRYIREASLTWLAFLNIYK